MGNRESLPSASHPTDRNAKIRRGVFFEGRFKSVAILDDEDIWCPSFFGPL
jgi:hypothetical protein